VGHTAHTGGFMNELSDVSRIKDKIYVIRGVQVMLDSDLAAIYGYETKNLNRQVNNNISKFPEDMMFQLTREETGFILRCKNFTSSWGGIRYFPYAFTEQGIYMLMTVLKGELAVQQSLALVRTFKAMRDYLADNAMVFQRLDRIELKQLESDEKFRQIFKQLEQPRQDKAIIFFKGQMWDATNCIEEIISKAEKSIILIDGYVDRNTLAMLTGKKTGVSVTIYTSERNCKITEKEKQSFIEQYGSLNIRFTDEFHDRFIILDQKEMYHIGASIKDAGKKAFEISINEDEKIVNSILERLNRFTVSSLVT
jgi:phage regulator Rha-like protein